MTSFYTLLHFIFLILCLQAGQASKKDRKGSTNSFFEENPANSPAKDDSGSTTFLQSPQDAANAATPSGKKIPRKDELSKNAKPANNKTDSSELVVKQNPPPNALNQNVLDRSVCLESTASHTPRKNDPEGPSSAEPIVRSEKSASTNVHHATDSKHTTNKALHSPNFPVNSSPLSKVSPNAALHESESISGNGDKIPAENTAENATGNAVKGAFVDRADGEGNATKTGIETSKFPALSQSSTSPTGFESLAYQRPPSPFSFPAPSPSASFTPAFPDPISTAPINPITLYNPLTAVDRKVTAISFYMIFGFCGVCFFTVIVSFVYTSFTGRSAAINGVAKVAGVTSVSLANSSLASIMEAGLSQPSTPRSDAAMTSSGGGPLDLSQIDLI